MSITLKEIAKKANVSISTVSRVINNDTVKPASKETADKVWKIVKDLGYVPNQNARNLIINPNTKTQKLPTKSIGCIFTSTMDTYNDPFYSYIARGIQEEAVKRGYILGYSYSSCDKNFSALYNNIMANPVDGAIILGRFDKDTLEFLKKNIDILVYAGVNYVGEGLDEVICDGYKGATTALEYLIQLGHEKIGFIGEIGLNPKIKVINEHRWSAYLDTLNKNNIILDEAYVVEVDLNIEDAYMGMKKYLNMNKDHLPTAFYCANDFVAIGAMKAIQEGNLKIPDDISIVSLDGIEMSEYVTPPLTTINIPKEELGKYAVKVLIDKIEGETSLPIRVDFPFELIIRQSTSAIKG